MNEPPVCRHLASALLPWYLNGALGPDHHAMVRDHVESCDICAVELADLEAVARSTAPPAFDRENSGQAGTPTSPQGRRSVPVWILAVAVAVPVILGLVWVLLDARAR